MMLKGIALQLFAPGKLLLVSNIDIATSCFNTCVPIISISMDSWETCFAELSGDDNEADSRWSQDATKHEDSSRKSAGPKKKTKQVDVFARAKKAFEIERKGKHQYRADQLSIARSKRKSSNVVVDMQVVATQTSLACSSSAVARTFIADNVPASVIQGLTSPECARCLIIFCICFRST